MRIIIYHGCDKNNKQMLVIIGLATIFGGAIIFYRAAKG